MEGKTDAAMRELESAGQIARDASKAVIGSGDRLTPFLIRRLLTAGQQSRRSQAISRFMLVGSCCVRLRMS